jgi:YD repeat-containing protein
MEIEMSKALAISRRILLGLVLNMAMIAAAQQNYLEQLGPPQAGTVIPVELGNINLTNGDLHLEVPLGSFAQRGKFTYEANLVYDSRIWISGQWSPTFLQSYRPFNVSDGHGNYAMGGWRLVVSIDNKASNWGAQTLTGSCNNDLGNNSWFRWTSFSWAGPDGANHIWQNLFTEQDFGSVICPDAFGNTASTAGYADDGSGFYMIVTNYTNAVVFAPDGTQVYPTFKDTNGNYPSNDANGNVIDTLGRTPVITTVGGNNIYYDVLNAQGTRSRYTVTTESINVSVPNYSGTLTVFQSIGLPNGTSYSFGYDSGTSGDNWGGITSMSLPAGGQLTYGYTTYTDAWGTANSTNRWATSRSSGGGTWSYTPHAIGHTNATADQQTTVTGPSGDYVVYKSHAACQLGPFKNQERDFYNAAGTLLKQELIDYSPDVCGQTGDETKPIEVAALPIRLTSTIFGGSGGALTQKTEYDYTNSPSTGNPTKISEWNFYTGTAPANPDRIRQVTYSFAGNSTLAAAHITNKPLTVALTDGASAPTQIAQTTYTYDNYSSNALVSTDACQSTSASQPSPAAPQHDYQAYCTSNTVRGNLTQVSKWLNTTGGSITVATNTYDDTGNIVTSKDALSNPTNISYSASFGLAYPTNITNALNQVTTKNYDFNTGLLVSETDPNGQTTGLKTTYTYDNMGRLVETDFPDGGQIKTNFNGDAVPLTITTTQLATPDPSIVKTTVLDGLGRTQSECLTDPEGNDCVDTTYDANGRVSSKSNPHRTVAAASDGVTQLNYDGLDRPTSATEPDGNVVSNSYDTHSACSARQSRRRTKPDGSGGSRQTVSAA